MGPKLKIKSKNSQQILKWEFHQFRDQLVNLLQIITTQTIIILVQMAKEMELPKELMQVRMETKIEVEISLQPKQPSLLLKIQIQMLTELLVTI